MFSHKCSLRICACVRIAGDTALCKNIHESVSRQIRKNFAKSKWRVNYVYSSFLSVVLALNLCYMLHWDSCINRLPVLKMNHWVETPVPSYGWKLSSKLLENLTVFCIELEVWAEAASNHKEFLQRRTEHRVEIQPELIRWRVAGEGKQGQAGSWSLQGNQAEHTHTHTGEPQKSHMTGSGQRYKIKQETQQTVIYNSKSFGIVSSLIPLNGIWSVYIPEWFVAVWSH